MGYSLPSELENNDAGVSYRADGAATLANGVVIPVHTLLIMTSKLLCTPLKQINKYIPPIPTLRGNKIFFLLIAINSHPNCTINKLTGYINCDSRVVGKQVNYLLQLGYIKHTRRPRKMPIGAYVIDDTYRATHKGIKALRNITGL